MSYLLETKTQIINIEPKHNYHSHNNFNFIIIMFCCMLIMYNAE